MAGEPDDVIGPRPFALSFPRKRESSGSPHSPFDFAHGPELVEGRGRQSMAHCL